MLDAADYNTAQVGSANYQAVCILLRDEVGQVAGGLNGSSHYGWMFVDRLVVREDLRGQGLGSRLLTEAEDKAKRRGCIGVYLDTHDFQAKPFYEKHGYTEFGVLEDFPPGHKRHFLFKRI